MAEIQMTPAQFQRIREVDFKLSRAEFAKVFGFSDRHVRDLENGIKPINHRTALLLKLAKKAHEYDLINFNRKTVL
jgi:DNA-binding transcriptional regulator YiaG